MRFLNKKSTGRVSWALALSTILGLAGWRILSLGEGNTFFFDEWNFLLDRSSPTVGNWLSHHNGHLSVLPVVGYQVLLQLFGAGSYLPYRALAMLLHCAIALVVALMIRRRSGSISALVGAGVVAYMGSGWQNWLWGFQIGMELSVLTGLLAIFWVAGDQSQRRQWLVIGALVVSVLSSGVGVSVLIGVFVASWRRGWGVVTKSSVLLFSLYGLWSLSYGDSQADTHNFLLVPSFMARSAAAVFSGIGGWDPAIGGVLAGTLAAIVLRKTRRLWNERPEVPTIALVVVVGWILSAMTRAQFNEPGASRYVHVGVSLVVPLVVLILANNGKSWRTNLTLVCLGALSIGGSWDIADAAGREFRDRSSTVRAELTALLQVTEPIEAGYQPDRSRAPQITYERLAQFGERFNLPLMNANEVKRSADSVRKEMDRVYLESAGVKLIDQSQPSDWSCNLFAANHSIKVAAGESIWLTGVHSVEVRRLSREYQSLVPSPPGTPSLLRFGRDVNPRLWTVRLISAGDVEICEPTK